MRYRSRSITGGNESWGRGAVIDARIKIRHLQCFLETARLRHVGRAADRLCVTQPAVSKTIRELEDILAVQLFERSGRGLALTSVGRLFQEYAQTGITSLEQAIDSVVVGRSAEPEQMIGLQFEQLYMERLALVVRPGHPLLEHASLDLRQILDYPV